MVSREKFCEKLYLLALSLYSFSYILMSTYVDRIITNYTQIFGLIRYFCIISLLFIFLANFKYTKKKILLLFITLLVVGLILINNNDKSLLVLILLIISYPKKMSLKNISKYLFYTNLFAILVTVLMRLFGLIPDYISFERNIIRHGMGFVSANAFSNLVTATILLFIYYKNESWKFIYSVILILILLYINSITGSRLSFILGIISIVLIAMKNRIIKSKKATSLIYSVAKYIFPFLLILLIVITMNLKSTSFNGIIGELNTFFSGRIGEMYIFYNQYGIKLFGQTIYTIGIKDAIILGQKWTGLDTSYLNYTLRYGIIFMSFISIMYIKIGNYIKREKMLVDAIYIIIICIMATTENIIFVPHFNLTIFLIAKEFSERVKWYRRKR